MAGDVFLREDTLSSRTDSHLDTGRPLPGLRCHLWSPTPTATREVRRCPSSWRPPAVVVWFGSMVLTRAHPRPGRAGPSVPIGSPSLPRSTLTGGAHVHTRPRADSPAPDTLLFWALFPGGTWTRAEPTSDSSEAGAPAEQGCPTSWLPGSRGKQSGVAGKTHSRQRRLVSSQRKRHGKVSSRVQEVGPDKPADH